MDQFWLAETDFVVPVRLTILRRNRWLGDQTTGRKWDDEEHQTVEHVRWKQSGTVHEISYHEAPPSPSPDDLPSTTVCRLEPRVLIWQRHGGVEWEHVFESGSCSTSIMSVPGAGSIEVQLTTRSLHLAVGPSGGSIDVAYDMVMSNVTQYVEIGMRFERH